jgi:sigma-54 dependent transcriptional regulator, acetoin dehydrogenase operon transcriptional activator AcoR
VEARHLSADLAAQLPASPGGSAVASPAPELERKRERATPNTERARILAALTAHRWRPDAAAAALGISRATLYRRIAKHGIVGPHRT